MYYVLSAICGIQNNTLIFNIFGTCKDATIFWTTNAEELFDLLKIMHNCASTNQSSARNTSNSASVKYILQ